MHIASSLTVIHFAFQKRIKQSSPLDCERFLNVIKYTKANLDEPITLKQIAGIACMTEQSFCRFFKKKTNKKFFEYLHTIRMQHALELLVHTSDNSICDIAYACGYNSSSHFCRIFKSYFGESPYRYRSAVTKLIA